MVAPWLIAGLGNPGPKYERTRHNAGFWFLEALARCHGIPLTSQKKLQGEGGKTAIDGSDCVLLKPATWMNESGQSLRAAMDFYRLEPARTLVAYDDLDLPPGTVRLKKGGGHGGHNGLRSIGSHLGTPDYWRLRIGIGHPGVREAVTPWVLSRPGADDERAILDAVDRAVRVIPDFLSGRDGEAMKALHTREPGSATRDSS